MIARTYPWEPLWALASGRGVTMTQLGEMVGRRAAYRWRQYGYLTEAAADAAAVALGVLPGEVWPAWDEDGLASADEADAARRAKAAEWKRRKYQTDPEHRADRLARNRQWKAENSTAVTFKAVLYRASTAERRREVRRARYQANREVELARQRAYDRRKREEMRRMRSEDRVDNVA